MLNHIQKRCLIWNLICSTFLLIFWQIFFSSGYCGFFSVMKGYKFICINIFIHRIWSVNMCLLHFALFLSHSVISFHAHLFITVYPPHHLLRTHSFFSCLSVAQRPWFSQSRYFFIITLHLYTLCYHFSQALLSRRLLASVFSSLPWGFIFTTEIRGHALNIFPPCCAAGRPPPQLCCVDTLIFCTVACRYESMWIEERRGIVVWESMSVLIDVQWLMWFLKVHR